MDLFGGSDDYAEYSVDEQQRVLYEQIGFGPSDMGLDPRAHDLFYTYYYNDDISLRQRLDIWEELKQHLENEYNIAFEEIWDWEAFREWYDSL